MPALRHAPVSTRLLSRSLSAAVLPRRRALALACASAALMLSAAASAQDAQSASATSLDTITVTADHRERNLQDVPVCSPRKR